METIVIQITPKDAVTPFQDWPLTDEIISWSESIGLHLVGSDRKQFSAVLVFEREPEDAA